MIHMIAAMALISITHTVCFATMIERKYSIKKTAIIYALFCLSFVFLTIVIFLIFGYSSAYVVAAAFLMTIIAAFFVFVFTSADLMCKKLFLFVSQANIFSIFQCIAIILCGTFFPNLPENSATYVKNIMRTLLYIPMIWIYIRCLKPTIRKIPGTNKKSWYSISLVSALFTVGFLMFMSVCHAGYDHVEQYISLFVIFVVIYCSTLWGSFETIRSMINENKIELISLNMKYLQGQLKTARENELFAKTIRHDFRHHNLNIASMLKKGEIREALLYIDQYNESLDAVKPKEFCPNVTVNAVLNSFYTEARNAGISVLIDADTQEETAIADMDFVAILSNLLENALNGCKECNSGGEIKVNIRSVADKTVIVCSNPCKPDLAVENNMLKDRGIGIDSMVLAARKYDGDIRYSLENAVLTVCIILKS
ncbi:MAG: hypothetical protein DBX38_06760 [Eubacteriales Family XIII. Incertae Sedis bacterium]|nr:MAG: hypothetical protein DBX38_06760 [Clostridiales Family XIII bacterium]